MPTTYLCRYLYARHIAPRFLKYDVIALYRYINSNSPPLQHMLYVIGRIGIIQEIIESFKQGMQ